MEHGSGDRGRGETRGPGGGWRALLADVRGVGDPLLALLDPAVVDEPGGPAGRWCPEVLEDAWREASLVTVWPSDTVRQVS